jgi:regulatory protein
MSKTPTKSDVLGRLQNICSKTEKSPKDILDKLKLWKYEGDTQSIIETLKQQNFINEERYASAFVNDKIKFSKWGKIKVSHYLKMKGIEPDTIKICLEGFPYIEYLEMVESEVKKKNKSLKETDDYKRKQKLLSFSTQRGYEIDVIHKLLDKII